MSSSSSSTSLIISFSSQSYSTRSTSSSSSKSSISSTSSSSSSFHYHYNKTFPFSIEERASKSIMCLAYDGTYIYAGTANGDVLRSINGMTWDLYFKVNDICVSKLYVANGTLYIGTSPNGYIYTSDLLSNKISLTQTIGNEISSFISYNNRIYAFTSNASGVYRYNINTKIWELIYSPYASTIYKTVINNGEVVMLINSNNIIRYNGVDFYLQKMKSIPKSTSSSSSGFVGQI